MVHVFYVMIGAITAAITVRVHDMVMQYFMKRALRRYIDKALQEYKKDEI